MEKKIIIQNRKARFNYQIDEVIEAGIVLKGTEVKSLRAGKAGLTDSYAIEKGSEIFLLNLYIGEYEQRGYAKHEPTRARKLLLKSREINKLIGLVKQKGVSLIPLSLYFNERNLIKVELGIAAGKKQHDKRETIKERDWKREQGRIMKHKGRFE